VPRPAGDRQQGRPAVRCRWTAARRCEGELFSTAQDLAERERFLPTLGAVVAALVERVGQRARIQGADEEFIATLTYTVGIAAEGMANRARAAAVHD
jgi:hypothetical protein